MSRAVDIFADLGQSLREARLGRHESQKEAAAAVGVSERTWQDWEAGKALPQLRHRARVVEYLAASEKAA